MAANLLLVRTANFLSSLVHILIKFFTIRFLAAIAFTMRLFSLLTDDGQTKKNFIF